MNQIFNWINCRLGKVVNGTSLKNMIPSSISREGIELKKKRFYPHPQPFSRNGSRAFYFTGAVKSFLHYLIFFLCVSTLHANSLYPLESHKQQAQFDHLLKDLRCLVCQNQDLADSNAELAKDLRLQVYILVKEGKTDSEISDYLTSRYGDFILFKPPVKTVTLLLWFGPLIFLLLGLFIFWRTCFSRAIYE